MPSNEKRASTATATAAADRDSTAPARPWEQISSSEGTDDSSIASPNSSHIPDGTDTNDVHDERLINAMDNQALDEMTESIAWWRYQDEIVISGVSCRLPDSDNMEEFAQHLLNGDDMISEDDRRWEPGLFGLPRRHGKIKELRKFDASFFNVHPKQANNMDPQLRLLLEVAYESIVDSGVNPLHIRGSRTGVFVGCSGSETAAYITRDPETISGYGLTGCVRSMFANRLSYFFDFRGPSFAVDTACSSSLLALQLAVDAIRQNHCDAALVAGTHLTLTPTTTLQFMRLGLLSSQGMCRSFDANGEGYARSEGVVSIFLQKSSVARRCYATVIHAKSNTDGYKEQGITFPSGDRQAQLLREVYREAGIDPAQVVYIETHGTGTKVGDPQEANAICDVYCNGRDTPLLIGSVKSNMGHAEPASGLAAVAKMIIAIESGYIPPNLHFEEPNPYIHGLHDGRLKVVTEKTKWNGGLMGINSFGFGGSNTHILLRSYPREVSHDHGQLVSKSNLPRIVCVSGRTQEAVGNLLSHVENSQPGAYFLKLLNELIDMPQNMHPFRGYTVIKPNGTRVCRDIQKSSSADRRPVWFIYSGMGTQWIGMGRDMLDIDVFRCSILRCAEALKAVDVDLMGLLMKDEDIYDKNPLNSFICICAIQIALTDLLKYIDIVPQGIIGHSTGEMASGYCDECLTTEETMLTAYYRGKTMMDAHFPPSGMAAVGLSWEETINRCSKGVYAACHNAKDSTSVSGELKAVEAFVNELKAEGIFAKVVNSAGMAFHSPMMKKVEVPLRKHLKSVIKEPKLRSPRWISSSVPEKLWNTEAAKYCSPEYHINNTTSVVLFYDALKHVPENAVVIEVAPHCLLQAIFRRALPNSCTSIGLMKMQHANNVEHFISAIGKLYAAGVWSSFWKLYPSVAYPVPRGTPMISPLIHWDHVTNWPVISGQQVAYSTAGDKETSYAITIDPFSLDSPDHYLLDHIIDGRVLFPFTGHLVFAWQALCRLRGLDMMRTPVIIEDVRVHRATIITESVQFNISVSFGNGNFEIMDGDSLAASGRISIVEGNPPFFYENIDQCPPNLTCERIELSSNDVYKEMQLRGYEYGPNFRCIYRACNSGDRTSILWTGNWTTFIDSLLQTSLLMEKSDKLKLPTRLRYLRIDPQKHLESLIEEHDKKIIYARCHAATLGFSAGGVEVCELVGQTVPRRQQTGKVTLERILFIKQFDDCCLSCSPDLRASIHHYRDLCRSLLHDGLKKLGGSFESKLPCHKMFEKVAEELAECPSLPDDEHALSMILLDSKHTLFRALYQLFFKTPVDANFYKNCINIMRSNELSFYDDLLMNASWTERPLKPLFDIALENTAGHSINVCMFEPPVIDNAIFCRDLQISHPLSEPSWTLIGPKVDQFNVESVDFVETYKHNMGNSIVEKQQNQDIAILDKVLHQKKDIIAYLEYVKLFLREDGFVVVNEVTSDFGLAFATYGLQGEREPPDLNNNRKYGMFYEHDAWLATFEEANFDLISYQSDNMMSTVFLLRRKVAICKQLCFVDIDDLTEFEWVENLQKVLLSKSSKDQSIWLVSTKRKDNGMVGLALCLRDELVKNRIRSLMDASLRNRSEESDISLDSEDVQKLLKLDLHSNIYRDGAWGSFRHITVKDDKARVYEQTQHAFLNTVIRNDLSSLSWVTSPNKFWRKNADSSNCRMCHVYYASLNFRDIMLATGRLSPDAIPGNFADRECLLGMEFAGRLEDTGKRVMGLLPCQALATTVITSPRFMWEVPDHWSLEEAATVPVVYTTAFYALVVRGRLRAGESVLIHSGSGGVGNAAIAIALSMGCDVYTTVGSEEKKRFLQKRFPQMQNSHFGNSRTAEFEFWIKNMTDGRGVDLVLNSLSEEKLQASVRCLAQHGRFLEIGKFDLSVNANLGMACFLKNITFHGILLDSLMDEHNAEWQEVTQLMNRGINDGTIQPLPITVFPSDRAEEAFRFMAQGKHMGKVVLKIRDEEPAKIIKPAPFMVTAICRTYCNPDHVYIITGGLGGVGLELARWLISRGARKLVLTSRSGIKTGYQARCVYFWRRMGISLLISTLSIADEQQAISMIQAAQEMGPVGGVFHLAMVLRDCTFENQNMQNFKDAAEPKYWGTRNLDFATRKLCDSDLKWFVVFSSMSCGRGNGGQTNYGWANSTMERIMEQRRSDNLPGIAIEWGAIGDVGVILEKIGGTNSTIVGGTHPQRITSCMSSLDSFLTWNECIVGSFIKAATTEKRRLNKAELVDAVAHIIGIEDIKQVDQTMKLGDLGLDSLMGVEIKQTLERDFDLILSMKDIRNLTLEKLMNITSFSKMIGQEEEEDSSDDDQNDENLLTIFRLRIDADDLRPLVPIVQMNDVDNDATPLFCVHSIEGVGIPLSTLAQKLKVPVYCFQCTEDTPLDSVQSIAECYIQRLKKIQPKGPYRILGYSYGATIAFNMAAQLQTQESPASVEHLILLDGSHKYTKTYRNAYRLAYGFSAGDLDRDPRFECELLCAFTIRFAETDYRQLRNDLMKKRSWDERVLFVQDKVMSGGLFSSIDTIVFAVNSLRQKFLIADRYVPERKFQGDVVLIRAKQGAAIIEGIGLDYGLHEVVTGKVDVHSVEGDHDSFIHGEGATRTAEILTKLFARD